MGRGACAPCLLVGWLDLGTPSPEGGRPRAGGSDKHSPSRTMPIALGWRVRRGVGRLGREGFRHAERASYQQKGHRGDQQKEHGLRPGRPDGMWRESMGGVAGRGGW